MHADESQESSRFHGDGEGEDVGSLALLRPQVRDCGRTHSTRWAGWPANFSLRCQPPARIRPLSGIGASKGEVSFAHTVKIQIVIEMIRE